MKTSPVYAQIDSKLKEDAESVISKLGITTSSAIHMFYSQIALTNALPLDLKIPAEKPTSFDNMTRNQIDIELTKGINSLHSNKTYTVEEADTILAKEYNI